MRQSFQYYALLLAFSMFVPLTLTGYAQVSAAAVGGMVRDSSGAVVQDATVTLTNVATGSRSVTRTDVAGIYAIRNIVPGSYTLEIAKQGFATQKQPAFSLAVNQTATLNFSLHTGIAQTTVVVSARAVQLETATAELGNVVDQKSVNA